MKINFEISTDWISYLLGCVSIGFICGYFELPFLIVFAFFILWGAINSQFQSLKERTYYFKTTKDKNKKVELL